MVSPFVADWHRDAVDKLTRTKAQAATRVPLETIPCNPEDSRRWGAGIIWRHRVALRKRPAVEDIHPWADDPPRNAVLGINGVEEVSKVTAHGLVGVVRPTVHQRLHLIEL